MSNGKRSRFKVIEVRERGKTEIAEDDTLEGIAEVLQMKAGLFGEEREDR